jgi:hypothetical protein
MDLGYIENRLKDIFFDNLNDLAKAKILPKLLKDFSERIRTPLKEEDDFKKKGFDEGIKLTIEYLKEKRDFNERRKF